MCAAKPRSRAPEGRLKIARRFSAGKSLPREGESRRDTDAAPQTAGVPYSKLRPLVSGNCVAIKLARKKAAPQR